MVESTQDAEEVRINIANTFCSKFHLISFSRIPVRGNGIRALKNFVEVQKESISYAGSSLSDSLFILFSAIPFINAHGYLKHSLPSMIY